MKITTELEINLTPKQLAHIFANMYSWDQAKFFNELLDNFPNREEFEDQMRIVESGEILNPKGLLAMNIIGNNGTDL